MQVEDRLASTCTSGEPDWPAQHRSLDDALSRAARGPIVDARFDKEVWARIRNEETAQQRHTRPPLWLRALNALAIGVIMVSVVAAFTAAVQIFARSPGAELALTEPTAVRFVVVAASMTGLWLGVRRTPLMRTIARQWLWGEG